MKNEKKNNKIRNSFELFQRYSPAIDHEAAQTQRFKDNESLYGYSQRTVRFEIKRSQLLVSNFFLFFFFLKLHIILKLVTA